MSTSKKQLAWGYMRRNRTFRVGDILIIVPMSTEMMRQLLFRLNAKELIRLENKAKKMKDRVYTLLEDKGAQCPV